MEVERRSVEDLVPYIGNARTHPEWQIDQIAASIAEFGFCNPILIGDDGVIIAGHGRLMAARKIGLADVPVIVLGHLSPEQRRALVIADNQIAENAGWDLDKLRAELDDLRADGFDLGLVGFSAGELDEILGGFAEIAPEAGGASDPLAAPFALAPVTVLDARSGWWQARKRSWLLLGIRSELGRGEGDRACPGGSPLPGAGSRKGYQPGMAKAG